MAIALRYLDTAEMIALSSAWLGAGRAALERIAELEPLVPRLEAAHLALQRAHQPPSSSGEALRRVTSEARDLDDRHDHAVRAMYFALSAAIEHQLSLEHPDIDLVTGIEVLRDLMLPEGLSATQASYEEEASAAARASEAVAADKQAQKLLEKLHVLARVTGLDLLSSWSELGRRLGALELERSALSSEGGGPPQSAARSRNAWLGLVATMLSVAEHAGAGAEAIAGFKRPLEEACAKAQERYAASRKRG